MNRHLIDSVRNILLAVVCILQIASCVEQIEMPDEQSDVISFSVTMSSDVLKSGVGEYGSHGILEVESVDRTFDSEQTKAEVVNTLQGQSAGVFAYEYDEDGWGSGIDAFASLNNHEFYFRSNDELVAVGTPVLWSGVTKDLFRVCAYTPHSDDISSLNGISSSSTPSFVYTVPDNISDQKDLIVSEMKEVTKAYNQSVPLIFGHALTAVRFKIGFDCNVKSLKLTGVYNSATYSFDGKWTNHTKPSTDVEYTLSSVDDLLMMVPQTMPEGANVIMTYTETGSDEVKTLTASLYGLKWEKAKLVTYTLHKKEVDTDVVYFDLALGSVIINGSTFSGKIWDQKTGAEVDVKDKNGTNAFDSNKTYYVYQSTDANRSLTGIKEDGSVAVPSYKPIMYNGELWSEWITNNTDVTAVIDAWNNGNYSVATAVGRGITANYINVTGNLVCKLTIDNLFSSDQNTTVGTPNHSGIMFDPEGENSKLYINLVGDNRFGNVRYFNYYNYFDGADDNGNELVFEGSGSLTVANVRTDVKNSDNKNKNYGYYANHYNSAIGGTDSNQNSCGITITGGTIYAGSTAAENCSAIGAGGNGLGIVKITGGTVTAVATTTGTAIGGGIGYSDTGGRGKVDISGGSVYAYNFENTSGIPSAAIGGAGSSARAGSIGEVNISGGNVYAYTVGGTAIGGGSSKTKSGGEAVVRITGGNIVAKSVAGKYTGSHTAGAGIGGGTGGSDSGSNGGDAEVTISGNPMVLTGSVGGGKRNNATGKIGHADITISGGDIQAQFVLAAGASEKPSFIMTGGRIRNSRTSDSEYVHIEENGGAVYLEDGLVEISGGEIYSCSAQVGGAIYIKGSEDTEFRMTGGSITDCRSETSGGAVYLEGGNVSVEGGAIISKNLAAEGNGGAVCIKAGNFSMSGSAQVTNNSAMHDPDIPGTDDVGNGGGIYISSLSSAVKVDLESGTITGNTSDRNGGGVCVDMEDSTNDAVVSVGKSGAGPSITGNRSVLWGGGLYVRGTNARMTIDGGEIQNNHTINYIPNQDITNEYGEVRLISGNVPYKRVVFLTNDPDTETAAAYLLSPDDPATQLPQYEQNIVTNTNSLLVAPEAHKALYSFKSWNTRADGKGIEYTDGALMNISEDITLYAQWTAQ